MTNTINRKTMLIIFSGVLTIILTGFLIGTQVYYKRKGTAIDLPQNNSKAEEKIKELQHESLHQKHNNSKENKLIFLRQSEEKIKELEEAVRKEQGYKKYKKNELEILIAQKLAVERSGKICEMDNEHYKRFMDSLAIFETTNPEMIKLLNKSKELDNMELKDNALEQKVFNEYFQKEFDLAAEVVSFHESASYYSRSFFYLVYYMCNELNKILAKTNIDKIAANKEIENLLHENKHGKIFKIYLFAEKAKSKIENTTKEILISHYKAEDPDNMLGGLFNMILEMYLNNND